MGDRLTIGAYARSRRGVLSFYTLTVLESSLEAFSEHDCAMMFDLAASRKRIKRVSKIYRTYVDEHDSFPLTEELRSEFVRLKAA